MHGQQNKKKKTEYEDGTSQWCCDI